MSSLISLDPQEMLDSGLPRFSVEQALAIVRDRFGVEGDLEPLYAERDQNFRIREPDGATYVLKIANAHEDAAVLDLQNQALRHVECQDPSVPVPRVIETSTGQASTTVQTADGREHILRLLSYLPGIPLDTVKPTARQFRNVGSTVARLSLALRGFTHPAADHEFLWDIRRPFKLRRETIAIGDSGRRTRIEEVLDQFEETVRPRLLGLRSQVIHNDANAMNVLVDEQDHDRPVGIIDFGDMGFAPLVVDLAIAAADIRGKLPDPVAGMCEVAVGYDAVLPLESEEVDLLYDLVTYRNAVSLTVAHWRAANTGSTSELEHFEPPIWSAFDALTKIGRDRTRARLRDACAFPPYCPAEARQSESAKSQTGDLLRRRQRVLGPGLALFYEKPIHTVRGQGVWLYDDAGRAYLDVYNNVPHVGHSHPHVARAVSRHYSALCTNTRYLYRNIVEYAERLTATFQGGPRVCVFVNSGSEANDLAWRMAKAYTGRSGALVNEGAYHGATDATHELSVGYVGADGIAPHVRALVVPRSGRSGSASESERVRGDADRAIMSLDAAGFGTAAWIFEPSFCTQGIYDLPEGYLQTVAERVRRAGGLTISDEVQAGFGRLGDDMWACQLYGMPADIVTMGKPMGNGIALGAVVTTPEILESFSERAAFFSTFGGNPVACAAGAAVLDVIERDALLKNAAAVGEYMRVRLHEVAERHPSIGDVRGKGLLIGVELVRDGETPKPAAEMAEQVMNALREAGVLVGRVGLHGNVLKVRPPMVFQKDHADRFIDALDEALCD